jgi:hypothetical protein
VTTTDTPTVQIPAQPAPQPAQPVDDAPWFDAIIAGWNDTDTWQVCRG